MFMHFIGLWCTGDEESVFLGWGGNEYRPECFCVFDREGFASLQLGVRVIPCHANSLSFTAALYWGGGQCLPDHPPILSPAQFHPAASWTVQIQGGGDEARGSVPHCLRHSAWPHVYQRCTVHCAIRHSWFCHLVCGGLYIGYRWSSSGRARKDSRRVSIKRSKVATASAVFHSFCWEIASEFDQLVWPASRCNVHIISSHCSHIFADLMAFFNTCNSCLWTCVEFTMRDWPQNDFCLWIVLMVYTWSTETWTKSLLCHKSCKPFTRLFNSCCTWNVLGEWWTSNCALNSVQTVIDDMC